jgi:8-oxo-dGTP pyrophosphatase MutT (NUDIX family)
MEEKTLLQGTLIFLRQRNKVLLAWKTKKICKDKWNGYGGGIENGESPREAAVRELEEESWVIADPQDLVKSAIIDFCPPQFICRVHVYIVNKWQGVPTASPEMEKPTWFSINALPLADMPPADQYWLPLVLAGKKIRARTHYGPFQQELLSPVEIEEVVHFED